MKNLLLVLLVLIVVSCNSNSGNRKAEIQKIELSNKDGSLKVTKVVDGDTFWADDGSEKGVKIRLIGVDAPESRNVFKKKKGYYGQEAKAYVSNLFEGQSVRLEYDVDSLDQYGRTLAYVYLLDGTFVNADLVKNGYAMVMTVPPNVKYADDFVKYQRDARENNRGLWKMNQE
ncbi:nuclease [Cryomorpha ignava]|uniref:Nuclease n=2 Tax=Cryomorpha ignava TaxID=101383 RepID=A0A7K3WV47_9FLAO|nr:nuclease [Cryomorpha ignava]